MSSIDFATSDSSPGLLCELVLKDEFTFEIPALEIFPKNSGGGGHSYIIEDMDVRQGFSNHYPFADGNFGKIIVLCRQMAEHFRKYIPYFLDLVSLLELAPLLGLAPPIRLQILTSGPVRVSAPP